MLDCDILHDVITHHSKQSLLNFRRSCQNVLIISHLYNDLIIFLYFTPLPSMGGRAVHNLETLVLENRLKLLNEILLYRSLSLLVGLEHSQVDSSSRFGYCITTLEIHIVKSRGGWYLTILWAGVGVQPKWSNRASKKVSKKINILRT